MEVGTAIYSAIMELNRHVSPFVMELPGQIVHAATSLTALSIAKVAFAILVIGYGCYRLKSYLDGVRNRWNRQYSDDQNAISNITQTYEKVVKCFAATHNAGVAICRSFTNHPHWNGEFIAESSAAYKFYVTTIPANVAAAKEYTAARKALMNTLNEEGKASFAKIDERAQKILKAIEIHQNIAHCVNHAIEGMDDQAIINQMTAKIIFDMNAQFLAALQLGNQVHPNRQN